MEVKRADGVSEFYRYDYAGNITRSVDGNGNATSYEYNRAGKLSRMTDPMGYSEEYHYDLGNRLCRMTDRNGTEVSYTYNLYGNLLGRKAGDLLESYEYTAEGLLKSAISQGMRYGYEYDAMGRLARKTASGRTLLSYAYDLNGNLTRQEDVTGKETEYAYNVLDLLEKVTDNGNTVAEYAYYPDGSRKSLVNGSLRTEYRYDADRNLTGLRTTLGEQVLADNRYSYDHNGSRTQKKQLSGTTCYTYDALNRLAKVEYPSCTEELFYDRSGNRSRRLADGVEEIYQYDPRNRLTEYLKGGLCTKYEYDNAGNLLVDDKARYAYDAFNQTERVETFDGHVQVNRYDAEGLRHEMEEDGKLVQFIYRGDEIVAEKTDDNIIRLIRGYDLTASEADWARNYYHYASDEMGSITHVVEDGEVRNHYEYDVWGNLAVCEETVPNRFLFTGQQYDPITQQYYLRARYYNPVIGRFTQEDTYRGDGLNLYTYCRNNPVSYVDPSGHWCDWKEQVYQGLLKREGLTADTVDPDTQLRLMAEAANLVKGKVITPDSTPELPDLSEGGAKTVRDGALRAAEFASGWENASLQEAINRFAPNAEPEVASNGKVTYHNPETKISVVYDSKGNYFRIEDTSRPRGRNYLDLNGADMNNEVVNGKVRGRSKPDYQRATHYNNIDKE